MKKRIIVTAAITACLALWGAVWPQAETVGEPPASPQTPAVSAPEPIVTEVKLETEIDFPAEKGDLTCRALVETYHKVKGKKLPWDDYKTPRFDDEAIQAIRDVADKYDIPVELITKLIVSVDTNKHITKNNKMQKAFDSIIGQGWLHYNSVEGALNHED